jgi:hypothetical protein
LIEVRADTFLQRGAESFDDARVTTNGRKFHAQMIYILVSEVGAPPVTNPARDVARQFDFVCHANAECSNYIAH